MGIAHSGGSSRPARVGAAGARAISKPSSKPSAVAWRLFAALPLLVLLLHVPAIAQLVAEPLPAAPARLDAADLAEQARVAAILGELDGPRLPPVFADSPLHQLEYADRVMVQPQDAGGYAALGSPVYESVTIPAGPGGTGTDKAELFWYQTPASHDPDGPLQPLVVAYHGFGASANSVALQSTIDEECNARGWYYLAPTGVDDKLFGSLIAQEHVLVAIRWMLDNHPIDPDRIYMVGFSMGGGATASFAARHRDPDDVMIAAIGIVSGSLDWTMTWQLGNSTVKGWLENPYNFGAPPALASFAYQRCSALHFGMGSYPPLPGLLDGLRTMASNLGTVPAWITWDLLDAVPEVLPQVPVLISLLTSIGAEVESHPVIGTPVPHSWGVLDEEDLFDFFEGRSVDRTPSHFSALLDRDAAVSWTSASLSDAGEFGRLQGAALPAERLLSVTGAHNLTRVDKHAARAGIVTPGPIRAQATSQQGLPLELGATGLPQPPAYFAHPTNGALLSGSSSEPATGTLRMALPPLAQIDAQIVGSPHWTSTLTSSPQPASPGEPITLHIDTPAASGAAWLLLGATESLSFLKGVPITVLLAPPTLLLVFGLDGQGNAQLAGLLPDDPSLSGVALRLQTIAIGGPTGIESVSNLWVLNVQ